LLVYLSGYGEVKLTLIAGGKKDRKLLSSVTLFKRGMPYVIATAAL
jgi:hypothetical protein